MPEKVEEQRKIIRSAEAENAIVAADMRQMLPGVQGVVASPAADRRRALRMPHPGTVWP